MRGFKFSGGLGILSWGKFKTAWRFERSFDWRVTIGLVIVAWCMDVRYKAEVIEVDFGSMWKDNQKKKGGRCKSFRPWKNRTILMLENDLNVVWHFDMDECFLQNEWGILTSFFCVYFFLSVNFFAKCLLVLIKNVEGFQRLSRSLHFCW